MSDIDAILHRIRVFRRSAGLSRRALALRANLSAAALVGMDKPDWDPSTPTIRALLALMGNWRPGEPLPEREAA